MSKIIKTMCIVSMFFIVITCVFLDNVEAASIEDVKLKSLIISQEALSPEFDPEKTNYSLFVPSNVNEIKLSAIPENSDARVNITGNTGLKLGDNYINIDVSMGDIKTQYKIIVTKSDDFLKSNSYLLNMIVENATLTPSFEPEIFEYDAGNVSNDVDRLRLLVFPQNEDIQYTIKGNDVLNVGDNKIEITVTSLDNLTKKTYTIKVHKNGIENSDEGVTKNEIEYINTDDNGNIIKTKNSILSVIRDSKFFVVTCVIVIIIILLTIIVWLKKNKQK